MYEAQTVPPLCSHMLGPSSPGPKRAAASLVARGIIQIVILTNRKETSCRSKISRLSNQASSSALRAVTSFLFREQR